MMGSMWRVTCGADGTEWTCFDTLLTMCPLCAGGYPGDPGHPYEAVEDCYDEEDFVNSEIDGWDESEVEEGVDDDAIW